MFKGALSVAYNIDRSHVLNGGCIFLNLEVVQQLKMVKIGRHKNGTKTNPN